MADATAKRMERGGRISISHSANRFFFFYTPPLSVLCVTLSLPPLCTALKRAAKLVPSDASAQWRMKNRQSSGHARAREVGRTKLGQRRLLDALTVNDYVVWGGVYLT